MSKKTKKKGNNPTGTNQWKNIRSPRPISVRLLTETDLKVRILAVNQKKTITEIVEEAIILYLEQIIDKN